MQDNVKRDRPNPKHNSQSQYGELTALITRVNNQTLVQQVKNGDGTYLHCSSGKSKLTTCFLLSVWKKTPERLLDGLLGNATYLR